jgi:hypothetical protein
MNTNVRYLILGNRVILKSSESIDDTNAGIISQTKKEAVKDSHLLSANKDEAPLTNNTGGHKPNFWQRLSAGVYFSPAISYRHLNGTPASFGEDRNNSEKWRNVFSFGIPLNYALSAAFFIRSGFSFMQYGEKGEATFVYMEPSRLNSLPFPGPVPGPVFPPQPAGYTRRDTVIAYTNTYNYLSIPACLGYRWGNKVYLSTFSGVLLNIYMNSKTVQPPASTEPAYFAGQPDYQAVHYNPYSHSYRKLNAVFSMNIESGIKLKRVSVFVAPSFNYFLHSIYASSDPLKEKPFSAGLSFGAFYTLGKSYPRKED